MINRLKHFKLKNFGFLKSIYTTKFTFCSLSNPKEIILEAESIQEVVQEMSLKTDFLSKIDNNIFKYLKKSNEMYNRLNNDLVVLSYELGKENSNVQQINREIKRINKELLYLSQENDVYLRFENYVKEINNGEEFIKEAMELEELDLAEATKQEINKHIRKIEEIREEFLNELVDEDENVSKNNKIRSTKSI